MDLALLDLAEMHRPGCVGKVGPDPFRIAEHPRLESRDLGENVLGVKLRSARAADSRSHRRLPDLGRPAIGALHKTALELLFEALVNHPHALALHQAIWQTLSQMKLPPALVGRYVDLTRDAVFYLDPHVCLKCRYRSTELLWQCPHCHEWNTFVEDRIAPAKETAEA